MAIRTLILSDVRLYREGLALTIADKASELEVVATCGSLREAVELVRDRRADVVLLDVGMEESVAAARDLARTAPEVRLVALALGNESDAAVVAYAEAGIAGYLPADASLPQLIATVARAARDEVLFSPRTGGRLVRRLAELSQRAEAPGGTASLTPRERQVVELLDAGLSNKEIARRLSIRLATVKNHVHNILEKLKVGRRGEAAAAARRSPWRGSRNGRTAAEQLDD
jgi:two-component system, NarL family, nitrate/nitrite response regulator NarL